MEQASWVSKVQHFLTGYSGKHQIKLKNLVSSAFKRHTKEEYNDILDGKFNSTNVDNEIKNDTPKPWLYSRVFLFLAAMYVLLILTVLLLGDTPFAYLTLIAGALFPVTLITFLSEFSQNEHISFIRIIFLFLIGIVFTMGIVAVIPTINFNSIFLACLQIGIVEELAKVVTIFLFFLVLKPKRVSTGLLIGFIVGAGFEIVESMGYSTFFGLFSLINTGDIDFSTMLERTFSSLGSHSFYGLIEAGAIMLSLKKEKAYFGTLATPRFWAWVGSIVIIHTLWNFVLSTVFFWLADVICIILAAIPVMMALVMLDAAIRDDQKFYNTSMGIVETPEVVESITAAPAVVENTEVTPVPETPVVEEIKVPEADNIAEVPVEDNKAETPTVEESKDEKPEIVASTDEFPSVDTETKSEN